jgi:hypothetical protein
MNYTSLEDQETLLYTPTSTTNKSVESSNFIKPCLKQTAQNNQNNQNNQQKYEANKVVDVDSSQQLQQIQQQLIQRNEMSDVGGESVIGDNDNKTGNPYYSINSIGGFLPSTMKGIDSLPKESSYIRSKIPSNPHLPIIQIKPLQE